MVDITSQDMTVNRADAAGSRRFGGLSGVPSWIITTASVVLVLLLWQYFGRNVNPVFGSYPTAIAEAAWDLTRSGELGSALLESIRPFLVGFVVSLVIGIPLGLLLGRFRIFEAAVGLFVTGGYAMPLVALVPLLVLWLGLGFAVKAAVIFLMCIFPIAINTWLGVKVVPKTLIEVGHAFVAPNSVILRRIVLPATLARISVGVRVSLGVALVVAVTIEIVANPRGLGYALVVAQQSLKPDLMFAQILWLALIGFALNAALRTAEGTRGGRGP